MGLTLVEEIANFVGINIFCNFTYSLVCFNCYIRVVSYFLLGPTQLLGNGIYTKSTLE